ncbi:MAG: NADPH-dependent oxidoreductase [Bacteroides sp.]|nr:NADPH-dependent oxidoreductase [Bacteroides sp.]
MFHHDRFFKNRHTVRKYTHSPVTDEEIARIVELASHAPTTGNMQLYSVVVTRDEILRNELSPLHFNQPMVKECSAVLTFCADFHRFEEWCLLSNARPGYGNFQSFITALLDTAIFAQQFCTIAEMNGLGCCYLGTTTYNAREIAAVLALPPMVVPVITITLGHVDVASPDAGRLPVGAVLHMEQYHDYTAQEIRDLYAEKEARDDSRKFVEENNKETLAQVFTDIRYTREANEHFSRLYFDFISDAGFPFPD